MSPSQNGLRQKRSSRLRPPRICSRDQSFLRRLITRSHSTITFNGGATFRGRIGAIHSALIARSREKKSIPSSRWPIQTLKRTPNGRGSVCRPKRSSNLLRAHRGGSFLCNPQYCSRYIVGTRGKGEVHTGTNHLGFRCVLSADRNPQPTGG